MNLVSKTLKKDFSHVGALPPPPPPQDRSKHFTLRVKWIDLPFSLILLCSFPSLVEYSPHKTSALKESSGLHPSDKHMSVRWAWRLYVFTFPALPLDEKATCWLGLSVHQVLSGNFSILALMAWGPDNPLFVRALCRLCSSIPGLGPRSSTPSTSAAMTTKTVSGHWPTKSAKSPPVQNPLFAVTNS